MILSRQKHHPKKKHHLICLVQIVHTHTSTPNHPMPWASQKKETNMGAQIHQPCADPRSSHPLLPPVP